MKKTVILALSLAIGQLSYGQISKGALYVTGFGSISSTSGETSISNSGTTLTTEDSKVFDGAFGIGGGYFLTENIAAGLNIGLYSSKVTPPDTSDPIEKTSGFGVGLFGRYYVPLGESFYFHGQLGFDLSKIKSSEEKSGVLTENPDLNIFGIGVSPGFTFFPTKRVGLDLSFGYLGWLRTSFEQTVGATTRKGHDSEFRMNFNMSSVTFGIQYFLF